MSRSMAEMSFLPDPVFSGLPGLKHGHGTRVGAVAEAFTAITTAHQPDLGVVSLKQVHGVDVVPLDAPGLQVAEADACFTTQPGLALTIQTADCLPVLVGDRKGRFVAAAHAGWRGTCSQVLVKLFQRLSTEFKIHGEDLFFSLGPAIAAQNYEVGPAVYEAFAWDAGRDRYFFGTPPHLDLLKANRQQLLRLGVPPENIGGLALDTFSDAARFHSYRREGNHAGRQVGFILLK